MRATRSYAASVLLALALSLGSCGQARRGRFTPPTFPDGGLLRGASPLEGPSLAAFAGVYSVESGQGRFGQDLVLKPSPGAVSAFAGENAAYAVLSAGCLDGGRGAVLEGYFRQATGSEAGLVRLAVEPPEAARALCSGEAPDQLTLRGEMGEDESLGETVVLRRRRPLRDRTGRFRVVAHRGGCRSSDDCGASENSLEVIRLAQRLGADGVEVDVRMTADGVPVLFHDEELSPRLASGTYCHGPLSSFTLAHLRALCTLVGGESIPTLDEALETAVEDTTLEGVWLDVKTTDAVGAAAQAAMKFTALAGERGRAMRVVMGLGDDDLVSAFAELPAPRPRCLVETGLGATLDLGCQVWGPRWTLGPMTAAVSEAQSKGVSVAFWTLDDPTFIDRFLEEARPNALLTNRPGLVTHRFELRGTLPDGPAAGP